jgi:phage tail-like protein
MTEQIKSRYLEYLPAIYHDDPFLGQLLLPFEKVLTGIEDLLSTIDRYFAPALTDREFLPWLATWVALVLDEEWDEAKRRRLIGEAVGLYRKRGTVQGLKRYLEIYTGLEPDIREWRWPGGMQIGVASQIGGPLTDDENAPRRIPPNGVSEARITSMTRRDPLYHDYYVVDTIASTDYPPGADPSDVKVKKGRSLQLYYRTDRVEKVEVGDGYVDIWPFPTGSPPIHYEPATITRRDGLIDDHRTLILEIGTETIEYQYHGDTFLIDEVEEDRPYRFIVDVRVPLAKVKNVKLNKVRAIVDLEKPAHTMYYLKLTLLVSEYVLQPMQIEEQSTIGLDTTVG